MFVHTVQFKWKPGITEADLAGIREALSGLPGQIAEVKHYIFGSDAGMVQGNFDFAIVAQFDNVDAWRVYNDHPVHDAVRKNVLGPHIAERAAVQFQV
jgi:hypothetical protein